MVELRGADLDQLDEGRVEALADGRGVQRDHGLVDLGGELGRRLSRGVCSGGYAQRRVVMTLTRTSGSSPGVWSISMDGFLGHFRRRGFGADLHLDLPGAGRRLRAALIERAAGRRPHAGGSPPAPGCPPPARSPPTWASPATPSPTPTPSWSPRAGSPPARARAPGSRPRAPVPRRARAPRAPRPAPCRRRARRYNLRPGTPDAAALPARRLARRRPPRADHRPQRRLRLRRPARPPRAAPRRSPTTWRAPAGYAPTRTGS